MKEVGKSARGSSTGKPIMVLFDVLGERWSLRILWELSQTRLNFRGLQEKCGNISPTVLNKRLKQFRALNFIDHNSEGYGYTEFGKQLSCHLLALESWANQWAKNQAEGQND
ncbi:hypothetical protein EP12_15990 [Alteromonas australica]|jgi:DNA-binding HxlR family transcriptional regulator|uniref:HTH hxlR-type domain-containing protein n=1 Tax=Alteromonas macleodii TaxID=28108 RepID=A0A126Q577_ALTMA|nr:MULTISPECIES: helix-turn-helix domain-containing protein [Alteromonas]MAF72080.1 transcriptional regulator [Alteromonas sp.]AGP83022.1 HxlR family transcriptional regulator [Alteromonas mediterranea MED64]AJP44928.1 hypothetical protein EP12_15990 [Alteromonas australica]AMJ99588.1 hypothetical protein AVL55_16360 [Alteromonas macleodii]MBU35268.1 transcriptional regulator [Alteromonas sp.]|tara:strand:- start:1285 stop:1620 length:336 start_codon:yes stop_codon:yes gene_type:complete